MSKLSYEKHGMSRHETRRKVRAIRKKGGVVYVVAAATDPMAKYAIVRLGQQLMNDTCVWLGDSHAEALSVRAVQFSM